MSAWVDDGTVELGGRTWAVRQSGAPDGRLLVYFHGTPWSRLRPPSRTRRPRRSAYDAAIVGGFRQMCSVRDGRLLDDPAIAAALVASMRISLAQGCEGAGWDNVVWVGPWDVELDDVRRPVHLWYGDDDPFCPAVIGPWLEEHPPDATLVLRAGEGHLGVMEHLEEVLVTLTGE